MVERLRRKGKKTGRATRATVSAYRRTPKNPSYAKNEAALAHQAHSQNCPKCGTGMVVHVSCPKCHFSPETAYASIHEAKEFTHPG